jgi:hypothetical protein
MSPGHHDLSWIWTTINKVPMPEDLIMDTRIPRGMFISLVVALLVACVMLPGVLPIPTAIATITEDLSFTPPGGPLATIPADSLATIRAPDYSADCLEINPKKYSVQVDFQGVLPGKTLRDQTIQLLGEPVNILPGYGSVSSAYEYKDLFISFDKQDVVMNMSVHVYGDSFSKQIMQFGCPHMIWTGYHVQGEQWTFFVYPEIGFEIQIYGFPISMNGSVDFLTYFKPTTLDGYFESGLNSDFENILFITWNDAIRR